MFRGRNYIILLLLLLASIGLRFQNQPSMWGGDIARDYLVANHIYKYQEFPFVGHSSTGLGFYYPPYYFYTLSFLMHISNNYFFILSIYSFLSAFSILLIYKIAQLWFSNRVGLLAALFGTFSSSLIYMGRSSWSVHIIVPFFLFSLLFFSLHIINHKFKYLLISLVILILASFIHYSAFPYIFLFSIISTAVRYISLKVAILTMIFILSFFFLAQIPLVLSFDMNTILAAFSLHNIFQLPDNIIVKFIDNLCLLFEDTNIFGIYNLTVNVTISFLIAILTLKKRTSKFKKLFLFFILIFFLPLIGSFKKGDNFQWYYLISLPLVFIIYAYMILHLLFQEEYF